MVVPTVILRMGVHAIFSQGTTASWISSHDFGQQDLGGRVQIVGHSDSGDPNNFGASLACPVHPGSLEITSRALAAVMCDADDLCSVNTAYEPESSFTTSPRNTIRLFYFLDSSFSCSEFLR